MLETELTEIRVNRVGKNTNFIASTLHMVCGGEDNDILLLSNNKYSNK